MTPIMSISGACFGLEDLVHEYMASIEDPSVTVQDHKEIARDMQEWINKLKEYNSYMSMLLQRSNHKRSSLIPMRLTSLQSKSL